MPKIERTDTPPTYSYPPNPAGKREFAVLRHERRQFYFGTHATPQSYALFALWLAQLEKTGKAPETKDLKPLVNQFLQADTVVDKLHRVRPYLAVALIAISVISTIVAITSFSKIPSSDAPALVDGLALTTDEVEFIRGARKQTDVRVSLKPEFPTKPSRHSEILRQLMEGHVDEPIHKPRKGP